ncbi:MAG: DUF6265 family protein [Gemmatimonadaceae bacterium]
MKHFFIFSVALLAALPLTAQSHGDVNQLGWMSGCWEQRSATRVANEQWMAPLGHQMMGMSRTVVKDSVREYESLRVEMRAGKPVYVALPSGQAEAVFTSAIVSDTLVRFSNLTHDYPQHIVYKRVRNDSLLARIEGTVNGKVRNIDYPMARVACAGPK